MRLAPLAVLLVACDTAAEASPDVEALAARLDALDQETTAGFAAQGVRIEALEARVAELETAAAEDADRIATLEAEVDALDAALIEVTDALALVAGGDLTAVFDGLTDHEARLAALEGAGLATEAWVTDRGYATEGWVTGQGYAADATVTTLAGRVSAAEADVASLESGASTFASDLATLRADVDALDTDVAAIDLDVADLAAYTPGLDALWTYLSVDTAADTVTFAGANVHVVNGAGATDTTNGLGNLVVGYGESDGDARTGSHTVVVGARHGWTSYGGIVSGDDNVLADPWTSSID